MKELGNKCNIVKISNVISFKKCFDDADGGSNVQVLLNFDFISVSEEFQIPCDDDVVTIDVSAR